MQSLDSSNSGAYTVGRSRVRPEEVESKIKQRAVTQQKILDRFLEIEQQLDSEEDDIEKKEGLDKRRRRKWRQRGSDFLSVSTKTAQEDLDDIYDDMVEESQTQSDNEFKVNDPVTCVLGKRKFQGVIFRTNSKGVVIKTDDRKKIKLEWDSINGGEIQLLKVKGTNEE
ncbi:hypothetical protein PAEPH01_0129 [Pancytospora epiphaga]|nr:hypothetical protein PAEPH01_0129 [Pancytospora epiphaga]